MTGKLYVSSLDDLNDYEREHNRISYARLCDRMFSNMILCNDIVNVDTELYDHIECGEITEDTEIYQYYLVSSYWDIDQIKEKWGDNLIIAYSELLDLYVLCVDHYGTSWDYVLTDIEPTTEL